MVLAIPLLTALAPRDAQAGRGRGRRHPDRHRAGAPASQRGFDRADAEARIQAQISREERVKEADYVLDNSGDRAALEAEVATLWDWLQVAAAERRAHA